MERRVGKPETHQFEIEVIGSDFSCSESSSVRNSGIAEKRKCGNRIARTTRHICRAVDRGLSGDPVPSSQSGHLPKQIFQNHFLMHYPAHRFTDCTAVDVARPTPRCGSCSISLFHPNIPEHGLSLPPNWPVSTPRLVKN